MDPVALDAQQACLVAGLHTVSVVVVQAVLTPSVHVDLAVQALHGSLPEVEKVVPATHWGETEPQQYFANVAFNPPSL